MNPNAHHKLGAHAIWNWIIRGYQWLKKKEHLPYQSIYHHITVLRNPPALAEKLAARTQPPQWFHHHSPQHPRWRDSHGTAICLLECPKKDADFSGKKTSMLKGKVMIYKWMISNLIWDKTKLITIGIWCSGYISPTIWYLAAAPTCDWGIIDHLPRMIVNNGNLHKATTWKRTSCICALYIDI